MLDGGNIKRPAKFARMGLDRQSMKLAVPRWGASFNVPVYRRMWLSYSLYTNE